MNAINTSLRDTGARVREIVRSTDASIGLLNAIDGTVDTLVSVANIFHELASLIASRAASIRERKPVENEYIDPDDVSIDGLFHCASELKDALAKMVLKRAAIDKDQRLKDHHCEELHEAYETAMQAIAALIEEAQVLRDAIITHDLAAEPRRDAEGYASVEDLISGLRNQ